MPAVAHDARPTSGKSPLFSRTLAILGLIAMTAVVIAFTSSSGDWYADGALVIGVVLLIAALLRSGASAELRRRRTLAIACGSLAGHRRSGHGRRPQHLLLPRAPAATAGYASGVAMWYLGLFILAQPWARIQSAAAVPAP